MDAIISPARTRAAGLLRFLRLTLHQAARVAVSGLALFGLAAVVVASASASGTVNYGELCSILASSMMLMGFIFALVIGVRVMFTQESWQTFVSRFAISIGAGIAFALLVPTP